MRKLLAVAVLMAFGFMLGLNGAVMAQKKQASKAVWKAMVASLNDIQSITGALSVFDMERATTIADGLVKRETFISKMDALPEVVRKGHGKVADADGAVAESVGVPVSVSSAARQTTDGRENSRSKPKTIAAGPKRARRIEWQRIRERRTIFSRHPFNRVNRQ